MGTNYYWHKNVCEHCGRPEAVVHIGKSSLGWCFSLHVYPYQNYDSPVPNEDFVVESFEDWEKFFVEPNSAIIDEYGVILEPKEMIGIITNRYGSRDWEKRGEPPFLCASWTQFFDQNHAIPGPNGLVRHKDGRHCIGHGEGTWDLIVGDFS